VSRKKTERIGGEKNDLLPNGEGGDEEKTTNTSNLKIENTLPSNDPGPGLKGEH